MKPRAVRTEVQHVVVHVDRVIDNLRLRVELRAAELGLSMRALARQIGIGPTRLKTWCARPVLSRQSFARLVAVLGEGDWIDRPLPEVRPMTAEKMRQALCRKIG